MWHSACTGIWLESKFVSMWRVSTYNQDETSVVFLEYDFFVVNRAAAVQNESKFPEDTDLYATIEITSYVKAYAFRGNTLNSGGLQI